MMSRSIHNDFFQHFFQHAKVVESYLTHFLPKSLAKSLDFASLRREKADFLPSRYRDKRSADALWSVRTCKGKEVIFHFEHQSYATDLMVGRLLEYRAAYVTGRLREKKGEGKVPPILTMVIYHGADKWRGPKSIAEVFTDTEVDHHGFFEDFLIDLKEKPLDALQQAGDAALPSMILSAQPTKDMCGILDKIAPLLKDCNECCRDAAIEYMSSVDKHDEAVFLKKLSKFDQPTANKYKTMFERAIQKAVQKTEKKFLSLGIEQGIQQGKQEGMRQGMQQAIERTIRRMCQAGVSMKLMAQVTGLSQSEVSHILEVKPKA